MVMDVWCRAVRCWCLSTILQLERLHVTAWALHSILHIGDLEVCRGGGHPHPASAPVPCGVRQDWRMEPAEVSQWLIRCYVFE